MKTCLSVAMEALSEEEKLRKAALIAEVTRVFEGDPDSPYGLAPDRAAAEAESFLSAPNANFGARPIDIEDESRVIAEAEMMASYQP